MSNAHIHLGKTGYKTEITCGDHHFIADEPESVGGTNQGPTPMQMLVGALGACMAITVRLYAERKKWPLEGVEIDVNLERFAGQDYAAYTGDSLFVHEIKNRIVFHGPLDDNQREKLLEIVNKCPVHRVLEHPVFFIDELLNEAPETP